MFKCLQHFKKIFCPILQKLRYGIAEHSFNASNKYHLTNTKNFSISNLLDESTIYKSNKKWVTTPYPKTILLNRNEKPKINPSDTSVILFPGQGIIKVGDVQKYMKFPRVKEIFDIANEILGFNLLKVCLKGPQNILNRTEFNQPATVVLSLAALEKLQDERPKAIESCVAVAGYSIGEITGLIFSGALSYEEGLKLVAIRGAAMQQASEISPQGMLFCYCLPSAKASEICKQAEKWAMNIGALHPICRIAIHLHTQGKIFGGCNEALEHIQKHSGDLGLRRVQRLPVSGGFHTILMEPALEPFIQALNKIQLHELNTTVYSNYKGNSYSLNQKVNKKYLIKQIVSPVKWEQIIQKIFNRPVDFDFPNTFDIASQGTLKSILKMINAKAAQNCYIY